jgi:hypothetical protein
VRGLGGEHTPIGADGTVDISPSARFCITEAEIITALYKGIEQLKAAEDAAPAEAGTTKKLSARQQAFVAAYAESMEPDNGQAPESPTGVPGVQSHMLKCGGFRKNCKISTQQQSRALSLSVGSACM